MTVYFHKRWNLLLYTEKEKIPDEVFRKLIMTKRINSGLLACFCLLTIFLEFGMIFAFGSVFVELLDKYQTGRATAAAVPSLLIGVATSFGVVSGALITKLGLTWIMLISCVLVPTGFSVSFFASSIGHLYVSIGIVPGVGISLAFISILVIIGKIFKGKKRIILLAVQSAFVPLSGVVYPYVLDWLIGLYGINGTFLVLGAVYCNKLPVFIICWKNRDSLNDTNSDLSSGDVSEDESQTSKRHKGNFILNALNTCRKMVNRTYLTLLFASASSVAAINAYLAIVLDFSKWKGYSDSQGLFTFVIINIANTLSRLVPGALEGKNDVSSFICPIISTVSGCVGQVLIYLGKSYAVHLTGNFLIGFGLGGVVSSMVILTLKVVHPDYFPVGSGLIFTMIGMMTAALGPLFGSFRDNSGSYDTAVVTIGVMQSISAIFFFITLVCRRIDNAKAKANQTRESNTTACSITITVTEF